MNPQISQPAAVPPNIPQQNIGYNPNPSPNPNVMRVWSTGTCECLKDEESCWWGTWCCCLLSARTSERFGIGSSQIQVGWFVAGVIICIVLGIIFGGIFPLFLLIGAGLYAYQTSRIRFAIRQQLNIFGTFVDDFYQHCCCGKLANMQEAREANAINLPQLDYISGQKFEDIASYSNEQLPESFTDLFNSLSVTTQLLLKLSGILVLIIFMICVFKRPGNLLILLIVFAQPFCILYFVYWKSNDRRKYAQLDYVIKLFLVGFFMATTQSIVFEEILQLIILVLVLAFALLTNDFPHSTSMILSPLNNTTILSYTPWQHIGIHCYQIYQDLDRMIHRVHRPLFHDFIPSQLVFQILFPGAMISTTTSDTTTDDPSNTTDNNRTLLDFYRSNILLIIIVLFLMAFVVAAGVEETMKHFVVRCCAFPKKLKDPQVVLVYLMAGALGFATAENIEYVFGTNSSPLPGTSLFVGELFVLAIRILMPIHVICSVLQATMYAQVVSGMKEYHMIMVLLPAIGLHGFFDFFLFLMSAIEMIYNIKSSFFNIFTLIMPFFITIGGIYWAYIVFNKVEERFRNRWQVVLNTETDLEDNISRHGDNNNSQRGGEQGFELSTIHSQLTSSMTILSSPPPPPPPPQSSSTSTYPAPLQYPHSLAIAPTTSTYSSLPPPPSTEPSSSSEETVSI
jgi:Cys-rich protein (TIGR01571 family)